MTPTPLHPSQAPPAGSTGAAAPDLAAAQALYQRRAAHYDAELSAFEPLRQQAISALALQPGETVLDLGCGTGLSLPLLAQAVGRRGRVLGVEPCAQMMAHAWQRVDTLNLRQVALLENEAAKAPLALAPLADAALFHFTHDVLQQPEALAHVLAHLKPGARVVACGLQWAPWWAWSCNAWVLGAALYSTTTLTHLHAPWQQLADALPGLEVQPCWFGTVFVAHGTVPA
ncbi:MAG TPA: methyltransferase domain-containing protein [Ideonella sp.]|uniref:class I SAM-dependent methyltransferase n=1 Tax=Ideonella sp. TaxID=1929293 RepID=UPI002BB5612B|nr:methyltransferase domain-containing protein [Ideonella sp.]HSI47787.1 methyltransferase domain-containing protein [Ideonella sp.]